MTILPVSRLSLPPPWVDVSVAGGVSNVGVGVAFTTTCLLTLCAALRGWLSVTYHPLTSYLMTADILPPSTLCPITCVSSSSCVNTPQARTQESSTPEWRESGDAVPRGDSLSEGDSLPVGDALRGGDSSLMGDALPGPAATTSLYSNLALRSPSWDFIWMPHKLLLE